MRKAAWSDRKKVVDIIVKTFRDNPGVNWMFKKSDDPSKCLARLASYAFVKAYNRNGALLSTNEKGVALYFKANERVFSLKEFLYELYFSITSISLNRIIKVLKRESVRRSFRPPDGNYLYFWFLAVLPEAAGAGFELKNALMREAGHLHIPIYLETAIERNKAIYEKIGFKTYHEWHDDKENIHFWFMNWLPDDQQVLSFHREGGSEQLKKEVCKTISLQI